MGINADAWASFRVGSAIFVVIFAWAALSPLRAETQTTTSDDGVALAERVIGFLRMHPRMRGRFRHTYLDRSRSVRLENRGRFVVQLPRARVEIEGDEPRSIALDETFARVLVPDAAEPLALSFRLDTTPLPSIFAALAGETPLAELYTVRRVEADGAAVLELRPIDPTALVDRMWLELADDGAPTRFLIVDTLGGTHRVVLEDVRYPASLPESAFALDVPAGATVIEP